MQKDLPTSLSSPILTVRTPIKRLGLSRKRKSTTVLSCETKIQILDSSSPYTSIKKTVDTDEKLNEEEKTTKILENKIISPKTEVDLDDNCMENLDFEKRIVAVQKRIEEKERILKEMENKTNCADLENLIEQWKRGCKNAFLHLQDILMSKQEEYDSRTMLKKLGIWNVMYEVFKSDIDLNFFDNSE